MNLVSKIFKPCALLLIALFIANLQTQAAPASYKKKDVEAMTSALDVFDAECQPAAGIWKMIEYELSSGQPPSSDTKQQLQYLVGLVNGMTNAIANMDAAARTLGHEQIMQDVANIKLHQGNIAASVKTLLDGILKSGTVDYNAVAQVSGGFESMARHEGTIRREIQVINGGK